MLDPWIIDEVLRRRKEKQQTPYPYLEMPEMSLPDHPDDEEEEEKEERGVVIVNYCVR